MKITIDARCNEEDMQYLFEYVEWSTGMAGFFKEDAGKEHYKLLRYVAKQIPAGSIIADIGTSGGHSAIALAGNPTVKVITYDLVDLFVGHPNACGKKTIKDYNQIECRITNCLRPEEMRQLATMPFIFLDVDPHNGQQEYDIIAELQKYGYKGLVLCDDIHLNPQMEYWWSNYIPPEIKKIDLTKYGHFSGTGALVFDTNTIDIEVV